MLAGGGRVPNTCHNFSLSCDVRLELTALRSRRSWERGYSTIYVHIDHEPQNIHLIKSFRTTSACSQSSSNFPAELSHHRAFFLPKRSETCVPPIATRMILVLPNAALTECLTSDPRPASGQPETSQVSPALHFHPIQSRVHRSVFFVAVFASPTRPHQF